MTTENKDKTVQVDSKVAEFLKSRATSIEKPKEVPKEKEKVTLEEDTSFVKDNYTTVAKDSFKDIISRVKATEEDKTFFTKSLLNDEPLILNISLYNKKLNVQIKSRSVFDQKVIMAILNEEASGDSPKLVNIFDYNNRMQHLGICVMVKEINGNSFPGVDLSGLSLSEAKDVLKEVCDEDLSKMNEIKIRSLITACAVFEKKVSLMENEAINGADFSNPAGSD